MRSCLKLMDHLLIHPLRVELSNPSAVVERLTRIEALLEAQGLRLDDIARGTHFPPGLSSPPATRSALQPLDVSCSPGPAGASPAPLSHQSEEARLDTRFEQAQFLIPYDHSTSANSLLASPYIKALIGDYPKDYFFTIEQSLPLPNCLNIPNNIPEYLPALSPDVLESLVQNYFSVTHPNFPIFTYQEFRQWHGYLYEHGPEDSLETAICLCVYALGCLVTPGDDHVDTEVQARKNELGLRFFQPALRIIVRNTVWGFRPSIKICQALILAASYFAHLGRPLHSWKMVVHASQNFIALNDRYGNVDVFPRQILGNCLPVCLLLDSSEPASLPTTMITTCGSSGVVS